MFSRTVFEIVCILSLFVYMQFQVCKSGTFTYCYRRLIDSKYHFNMPLYGIGRFAVTDSNNKHFFPDFFLVIDAKHGRHSKGDVYNSSKLVMSLNQWIRAFYHWVRVIGAFFDEKHQWGVSRDSYEQQMRNDVAISMGKHETFLTSSPIHIRCNILKT